MKRQNGFFHILNLMLPVLLRRHKPHPARCCLIILASFDSSDLFDLSRYTRPAWVWTQSFAKKLCSKNKKEPLEKGRKAETPGVLQRLSERVLHGTKEGKQRQSPRGKPKKIMYYFIRQRKSVRLVGNHENLFGKRKASKMIHLQK